MREKRIDGLNPSCLQMKVTEHLDVWRLMFDVRGNTTQAFLPHQAGSHGKFVKETCHRLKKKYAKGNERIYRNIRFNIFMIKWMPTLTNLNYKRCENVRWISLCREEKEKIAFCRLKKVFARIQTFSLLFPGLPNDLHVYWQQYPYIFGEILCKTRALVSEM